MSLLYKVLFLSACKNTHHKLALDSLRFLRGPHSENWRNLFVKHYVVYLSGSKAPDDQFKDFKNHVLHVKDNFWGGAVNAATMWYQRTVESLSNQNWLEAIYAAGVLTHYVTDPFMPLHTGQTEAEGKIHRAAEWSIACSYSELQQIIETDLGGYPAVSLADSDDWLPRLIRDGATAANEHYQAILDHYNLALGVKDPPAGLDQELKDRMAKQISLATVSVARVLDRAFVDARTTPPDVFVTLEGILATLQVPIHYITKKLGDLHERAVVEAIYDEVQQTGKAIVTLPEDEKTVRKLHAQEVLKKPLSELDAEKPETTGKLHGQGAAVRWRLSLPVMHEPRISALGTPVVKKSPPPKPAPEPAAKAPPAKSPAPPAATTPPAVAPLPSKPEAAPVAKVVTDLSPPRTSTVPSNKAFNRIDEPAAVVPPPPKRPEVSAEHHSEEGEPESANLRFYLDRTAAIVDAPSIGNKTARRLEAVGVQTVDDLLEANPEQLAKKLNVQQIDADKIREWQSQAALVCRVPGLRGHDAQILVAVGVLEPEELSEQKGRDLLALVEPFCESTEGERLLRGSAKPDLKEVMDWIRAARQARPLQQA